MRALSIAFATLVSAASIFPASALTLQEGKIVRGSYVARGSVKAAGFRAVYGPSVLHVTINGRVRGTVIRTLQLGSVVVHDVVPVSGRIHSLSVRVRKNTFTAPAKIRIGGDATFRGNFNGLVSKSQKPSRFFRGKVNKTKSNLTLRSN